MWLNEFSDPATVVEEIRATYNKRRPKKSKSSLNHYELYSSGLGAISAQSFTKRRRVTILKPRSRWDEVAFANKKEMEKLATMGYRMGGDVVTDAEMLRLKVRYSYDGYDSTRQGVVAFSFGSRQVVLFPNGTLAIGCQVHSLAKWNRDAENIIRQHHMWWDDSTGTRHVNILKAAIPAFREILRDHNARFGDDAIKNKLEASLTKIQDEIRVRLNRSKASKKAAATRKKAKALA